MNINYVFVRHGHGCHNAVKSLYNRGKITKKALQDYNTAKYFDPELTTIGVDVSIHNGAVISKVLKGQDIQTINVIGCSPLIRSMETAYYMTRKWQNPPKKIYVFPHLREIDESSYNKYSTNSLQVIDTVSSYAMKSIADQKAHLQSLGILGFFDFSFVEHFPSGRKSPGDIETFIRWYGKNFVSLLPPRTELNCFIVTHAGVLRDFTGDGYVNNSGFIVQTYLNKGNVNIYKSTNLPLPAEFFSDYSNSTYISKTRCNSLNDLIT
jgi:hypothetical protein